jgi:O-antigen/teichoic acid export membrane protein
VSKAPDRSRLRVNAVANIVGRAVAMPLWIVVTPYVLGRLGQDRFAVWTLFFLLNGYVISLDLGSGAGAARFVAVAAARRDRGEARLAVMRSLLLGLAIGVLWGLAGISCRELFVRVFHVPPAWDTEVRASLLVFSLSVVIYALSQSLLGSLVGFQRMELWNLYYLSGLVVHMGVLVVLLARGQGLVGAATAAVAGHSATALLAALSVRRELSRLPEGEGPPRLTWRDLLGYGLWVQAANLFGTLQFQAGRVLLGAIGRLAWVTTFELAFRAVNSLWSLSTLIQSAVVPAAAHAVEHEGLEGARRIYGWCCQWVILVGAYTLGLAGATAPALFTLWLGRPQPEVAAVARWIALGLGLSTLAGPATTIARGLGTPWFEALNFAIALAVNAGGALLLIPRLGVQGAGIAMAASFLIATMVLLTLFHRRIGVATGPWLARVALPRLLPGALAAIAVGILGDRWTPATRSQALPVVAIEGIVYTFAFVLATWPTGDARAVLRHARGALVRLGLAKPRLES